MNAESSEKRQCICGKDMSDAHPLKRWCSGYCQRKGVFFSKENARRNFEEKNPDWDKYDILRKQVQDEKRQLRKQEQAARLEKIFELRMQRKTYEEIGLLLGITRERVRQLGKLLSPEKKELFLKTRKVHEKIPPVETTCADCGKKKMVKGTLFKKQKRFFCSRTCAAKDLRKYKMPEEIRKLNHYQQYKWLYKNNPEVYARHKQNQKTYRNRLDEDGKLKLRLSVYAYTRKYYQAKKEGKLDTFRKRKYDRYHPVEREKNGIDQ